jgi:soluble lytic murein transglycosylase-like protein
MKKNKIFFFGWILFFLLPSCIFAGGNSRSDLIAAGFSDQEIKAIQEGETTVREINWRVKMRMLGYSEQEIFAILESKQKAKIVVVVKAEKKKTPEAGNFMPIIKSAAVFYGVEVSLVQAVIKAESNFNPRAVSFKGAKGLMQLMPETAKDMGVKDVFDPSQNIYGGVKYLSILMRSFDGRLDLVLAAYNAGPGKVLNGRIPSIKETLTFVAKVKRYKREYL